MNSVRFLLRVVPLFVTSGLRIASAQPSASPPTDPAEIAKWISQLQSPGAPASGASSARKSSAATDAVAPRNIRPPTRDEAALTLIPAEIPADSAIPAIADRIAKALRGALEPGELDEAKAALAEARDNSTALSNLAAAAWVERCSGTAVLLAAEAVRIRSTDGNALNTLGALLCEAGYAPQGIPLLRRLAIRRPKAAIVWNNLGQAWFKLGETEKAKEALERCLALAPAHGPAHASLGIIEHGKGNTQAGNAHFQAAVASNNSPAASEALDQQRIHRGIPASFNGFAPIREYFNPHHFVPPRPQRATVEHDARERALKTFQQDLRRKVNAANKGAEQASSEGSAAMNVFAAVISAGQIPNFDAAQRLIGANAAHPWLQRLATQRDEAAALEFDALHRRLIATYEADIKTLKAERSARIAKIDDDFNRQYPRFGEGSSAAAFAEDAKRCRAKEEITNAILVACADRYEAFESTLLVGLRLRINTELTDLPLLRTGPAAKARYHSLVADYLERVAMTSQNQVLMRPLCAKADAAGTARPSDDELPRLDCPIKITANFGPVTVKADCESVGFTFKAGLAFSARREFASGETTLTGGVGIDAELSGIGGVEGGGELVLVWNRQNELSFAGVQMSASAELSMPKSSGIGTEIADGVNVNASTKGPPKISDVKAETVLGVNTGPDGPTPEFRGEAVAHAFGDKIFSEKF